MARQDAAHVSGAGRLSITGQAWRVRQGTTHGTGYEKGLAVGLFGGFGKMQSERLLTVTIPAYNAEKFLERCLESLLSCSEREETELLVIDDGSQDGTGAIADDYGRRYPGIVRVIHKENGGHGSGINTGIAAARGKYFRVVDSDDAVNPEAYSAYLRKLREIDSDLIATPFVCVTAQEEAEGQDGATRKGRSRKRRAADFVRIRPVQGSEGLPREKVFFFERAAKNLHVRMHEWTIRTSILKEHSIRMSERCFYVDMQYILFPIPWIETCCLLDLPVYRYRLGDGGQSVSVRNMQKNRGQHERVLRSLVRFYREREQAGDSPGRLSYLARGIAKMEANQAQIALSLPVGKAVKRELLRAECYLKQECPAAYAANEKKSLRLLRGSGYLLYPAAAVCCRAVKGRG